MCKNWESVIFRYDIVDGLKSTKCGKAYDVDRLAAEIYLNDDGLILTILIMCLMIFVTHWILTI